MSATPRESTMKRPIEDLVASLAKKDSAAPKILLVASEPGRGRNIMLAEALAKQLPGAHAILAVHSMDDAFDLARYIDELETASVICVDGLGHAPKGMQEVILQLALTGHSARLPFKAQETRRIVLRKNVRLLFSEQLFFADQIGELLTSTFGAGDFRRVELS